MKKKILFWIFAASLICSSLLAEGIDFRKLCSGDRAVCGIKKRLKVPEIVMARSENELRRVWAEDVTGSYSDMKGLPKVDLDNEFVIAIFLGPRRSTGYSFDVSGVQRLGKTIEVKIDKAKPSPGSMEAQIITSPYSLITCSRTGIALGEVIMLRLVGADGKLLVERPAWAYRLMKGSSGDETMRGER